MNFKNKTCTFCHQKLPTKTVEPTEEITIFVNAFWVAPCPKCGGNNRLVEKEVS